VISPVFFFILSVILSAGVSRADGYRSITISPPPSPVHNMIALLNCSTLPRIRLNFYLYYVYIRIRELGVYDDQMLCAIDLEICVVLVLLLISPA
jgi:hypothetical protein